MALWATRAHYYVYITNVRGYYDERCPDGGITVPSPAFPDEQERIAALAEACRLMYERFPCREWQLLRLVQVHDVRDKRHARLMERDKAKRDGEFEAFMAELEQQMV